MHHPPLRSTIITTLKNPKQKWGGLMRNIDQSDFETANIEFIRILDAGPFY
jgi:cell surface protein SprA